MCSSDLAEDLKLFPNPATETVTLVLEQAEVSFVDLVLRDVQGRAVWLQSVPTPQGRLEYHFSAADLPSGFYYLQVHSEGSAVPITQKLIVQ